MTYVSIDKSKNGKLVAISVVTQYSANSFEVIAHSIWHFGMNVSAGIKHKLVFCLP